MYKRDPTVGLACENETNLNLTRMVVKLNVFFTASSLFVSTLF